MIIIMIMVIIIIIIIIIIRRRRTTTTTTTTTTTITIMIGKMVSQDCHRGKGNLSLAWVDLKTSPQKTTGDTITFVCQVHKTDNTIDISEITIVYSLECK